MSVANIVRELQYLNLSEGKTNSIYQECERTFCVTRDEIDQIINETRGQPSILEHKESVCKHFNIRIKKQKTDAPVEHVNITELEKKIKAYQTQVAKMGNAKIEFSPLSKFSVICPALKGLNDIEKLKILQFPLGPIHNGSKADETKVMEAITDRSTMAKNFSLRPVLDESDTRKRFAITHALVSKLPETLFTKAWLNILSSEAGFQILTQRKAGQQALMTAIKYLIKQTGELPELYLICHLWGLDNHKVCKDFPVVEVPFIPKQRKIDDYLSIYGKDLRDGNLKSDVYYKALEHYPIENYVDAPKDVVEGMKANKGEHDKLMKRFERDNAIQSAFA